MATHRHGPFRFNVLKKGVTSVKKWRNTIVLTLSSGAIAVTTRWWVPKILPLLGIILKNKETVGTFKDFVQIVVGFVTLAIPLFKAASDRKERKKESETTSSVASSLADRDTNVAHHSKTGGVHTQGSVSIVGEVITGNNNVSVRGDAVTGQKNVIHDGDLVEGNKYVITQSVPQAPTALHQLPPPPADFTGRTTELRDFRAAIEKGGIQIFGFQGQGGVGKTTLALKLAAELSPNFPDAQIYLDLKGVSEKPLTPVEAVSHVLRTFQPEARLPEKEDDLCALFRSLLYDKRALLLMDNAKDAAQVSTVIPPVGSILLVTSRLHFTLPGLEQKNIGTLPQQDAIKLLLRIAPRIGGEAEAIAKLCAYLALALRLAATAIAEHADLDPADHRNKLANERNRLRILTPAENGSDPSVEASFSLSYKLLDVKTQKRWRMLAIFPDTFDSDAAAAIWDEEIEAGQATLSSLLRSSMLEWNEATKRYRLHDLMRSFALQQWTESESSITAYQHAKHYVEVLRSIDGLYEKGGEFAMRGLTLFDLELENIQTGQAWAAAQSARNSEAARLCGGFSDFGSPFLSLRRHPREGINWSEAALNAARQLKDLAAEGRRLGNLGVAYKNLGEYRRAIAYQEQRLTIARSNGDRRGEAAGLANLGIAYGCTGEYGRAVEYFGASLDIAKEFGDRRREGDALGNLGGAHFHLGNYPRSIEYYNQHLAIAREIGDKRGEGTSLGGLGLVHSNLGDYTRAIDYHEKHLAIAREIGHRLGEANALNNLGVAYSSFGDHRHAADLYDQRIKIARDIGDCYGEGAALFNKGMAEASLGNRKEAIRQAEAALAVCGHLDSPLASVVRKQLEVWRKG